MFLLHYCVADYFHLPITESRRLYCQYDNLEELSEMDIISAVRLMAKELKFELAVS